MKNENKRENSVRFQGELAKEPRVMRSFDETKGPVINLHPSLLPRYPGVHAIEESFNSEDKDLGISVMRIDEGVDTGPVLLQKSFMRTGAESLEEIEARIHKLEYEWFPHVLIGLLDDIDGRSTRAPGHTP